MERSRKAGASEYRQVNGATHQFLIQLSERLDLPGGSARARDGRATACAAAPPHNLLRYDLVQCLLLTLCQHIRGRLPERKAATAAVVAAHVTAPWSRGRVSGGAGLACGRVVSKQRASSEQYAPARERQFPPVAHGSLSPHPCGRWRRACQCVRHGGPRAQKDEYKGGGAPTPLSSPPSPPEELDMLKERGRRR